MPDDRHVENVLRGDEPPNGESADHRAPARQSWGVDRRVGVALAVLIGLTVLFLGLSFFHKRPMEAFELQASSFAGFDPRVEGWVFEKRPVSPDPIEPNILSYRVTPYLAVRSGDAFAAGMSLRLVHGYNVRDCMRIKGYKVEEVRTPQAHPPAAENQEPGIVNHEPLAFGQTWRMVSPAGVSSVWAAVLLRADTFEATGRDVCSMPFPRVGIPDDPDWSPGGVTLDGLRHPVANVRRVVRAKWNASRSDLLTFLGFRRPTWVQSEWLTLVAASEIGRGSGEDHVGAYLLGVQGAFVKELRRWRQQRNEPGRGR